MIKCEEGKVSVIGTKKTIMVELMMLIHSINEKGIADRDEILENIVFALMTGEEMKKMLIDEIDNMNDIGNALNLLGKLL